MSLPIRVSLWLIYHVNGYTRGADLNSCWRSKHVTIKISLATRKVVTRSYLMWRKAAHRGICAWVGRIRSQLWFTNSVAPQSIVFLLRADRHLLIPSYSALFDRISKFHGGHSCTCLWFFRQRYYLRLTDDRSTPTGPFSRCSITMDSFFSLVFPTYVFFPLESFENSACKLARE